MGIIFDSVENCKKVLARFGLDDDLPGITRCRMFMKGWHRGRDRDLLESMLVYILYNFFVQFLDVRNGGTLGFVG